MIRLVVVSLALFSVSIGQAVAGDIKGSRDHPAIGRFVGSRIIGYNHKDFDEYLFPEGLAVQGKDGKRHYAKSEAVEGELTRILYVAPKEASVAEVLRNYQRKLESKGFQSVFSCKGNESDCGYWMAGYMENFQPPLMQYAYQIGENRYLSMKKIDPAGDMYVSILVYNYKFSMLDELYNHPIVQLDVIEVESLDDSKIKVVAAADINKALREKGRIALYGIYFDTAKARLKSESDSTLAEIVKVLNKDAKLRLHVVGHTDNTGSFAANMELSKQRASAVVAALISHGINAERLTVNGVSSLAPVASNSTPEGRAKNRRVEIVMQ